MNHHEEIQDGVDLSPKTSHPKAIQRLSDAFFWDCTDENSPFGNDTGADTLSFFRRWRQQHPDQHPFIFLDLVLEGWQVVNSNWEMTEPSQIQSLLEQDEYSPLVRDDVIIAIAFGQILLEGLCAGDVKGRAITALRRQTLPEVLAFRGCEDVSERLSRLSRMLTILSSIGSTQLSLFRE